MLYKFIVMEVNGNIWAVEFHANEKVEEVVNLGVVKNNVRDDEDCVYNEYERRKFRLLLNTEDGIVSLRILRAECGFTHFKIYCGAKGFTETHVVNNKQINCLENLKYVQYIEKIFSLEIDVASENFLDIELQFRKPLGGDPNAALRSLLIYFEYKRFYFLFIFNKYFIFIF